MARRSISVAMASCVFSATLCSFACTSPDDATDALTADPTIHDSLADPRAAYPVVDLGGPVDQWTWYDIPGSLCGFGQQTGIGVSPGTSDRVFIYLEGGGLCWDELSCRLSVPALPPLTMTSLTLASYFTQGFTAATFDGILAGGGYSAGIFDRTLPNNPFKDWTHVYVPYCTGDLHTGSSQTYFSNAGVVARWDGGTNLDRALQSILASFPGTSRVMLSGSSAGGFGALLDFPKVRSAFGDVRVDLISDSGPIFKTGSPFLAQGYGAWNTNAVVPSDCPDCVANYHALYAYYARTYPDSRFAILSHDEDLVISAGYLDLPYPFFYFAMKDFTLNTIGPLDNWRYFVSAGTAHTTVYDLREPSIQKERICLVSLLGHCLFYDPIHEIEIGRTVLADWLTQMVNDTPDWENKTSINQ